MPVGAPNNVAISISFSPTSFAPPSKAGGASRFAVPPRFCPREALARGGRGDTAACGASPGPVARGSAPGEAVTSVGREACETPSRAPCNGSPWHPATRRSPIPQSRPRGICVHRGITLLLPSATPGVRCPRCLYLASCSWCTALRMKAPFNPNCGSRRRTRCDKVVTSLCAVAQRLEL